VRGLAAPCGTDQGTGVKTTDSNRLHSIVWAIYVHSDD